MIWLLWTALAFAQVPDSSDFVQWSKALPAPEPATDLSDGYRFRHEIFQQVAERVAVSPGLIEPEVIGVSHQGEPIWAFHVRQHGVPIQRKVLVFASIHALEWISAEVATTLLLELAEFPAPGVMVTVIPMLNPDGRAKVEEDLKRERNAYRRGNAKNVDLNRDFKVHREARSAWRKILPGFHATSEGDGLTQPESKALDALADRERYDRAASLHAFGGFLYHPWSGRWQRTDDHKRFVELGRAMEQAQGARAYRTRQLSRWGFFFRAQGTELDHIYGKYGTLTYLVELTQSGLRPFKPKTFKHYFRWYNPQDPMKHTTLGVRAMQTLIRWDERTRSRRP